MTIILSKKNTFKYPFKLGCTSYVYPDSIIPNVLKMAEYVDDIEIVLFESEDLSNLPSSLEIKELAKIAKKYNLTYSIHFPIDKKAGSPNLIEREFFLSQIIKIIKLTSILPISGYVLHLEGLDKNYTDLELNSWKKRINGFINQLFSNAKVPPYMFCIENLGYPINIIHEIQSDYGFSACLDIGHLMLYEKNWKSILKSCNSIHIVHLHGVYDRKDHISLKLMDDNDMQYIFDSFLKSYTGVLTLEVFSKDETFESIKRIEDLWQKL